MKRSEICLINLDPTRGAEIQKTRPAVIVNDDALGLLPLRVVIPITEWKTRYEAAPWMVQIVPDSKNRLAKTSTADCFQIRSVSTERLVKRMGVLSDDLLYEIEIALGRVLQIRDLSL
jgi:mRNA interferase MazF